MQRPTRTPMLTTTDLQFLNQAERACEDALTLADGIGIDELASSRLTRYETKRLLLEACAALDNLGVEARAMLQELDFARWLRISTQLQQRASTEVAVIWDALSELVPATIEWLRVYRRQSEE